MKTERFIIAITAASGKQMFLAEMKKEDGEETKLYWASDFIHAKLLTMEAAEMLISSDVFNTKEWVSNGSLKPSKLISLGLGITPTDDGVKKTGVLSIQELAITEVVSYDIEATMVSSGRRVRDLEKELAETKERLAKYEGTDNK